MGLANRLPISLLRALALGATLAAAILVATSREKVYLFGLTLEAKYSDTPSFKYFVITNIIASVYSLAVLFLPLAGLLGQVILALDVAFTMLLTSSIGAALAIAQVGKKGNTAAGWLPICDQVPRYCHHVEIGLILGFVGLIIYFVILLYKVLNISSFLSKS
uniref:CASP-like protein n=1 Tax=Kalanchoe fedtschenkoi TaxID=63787 RepID=A0A7N0UML6_KALFE